jgi:hypothetical protein
LGRPQLTSLNVESSSKTKQRFMPFAFALDPAAKLPRPLAMLFWPPATVLTMPLAVLLKPPFANALRPAAAWRPPPLPVPCTDGAIYVTNHGITAGAGEVLKIAP